MLFIRILLLLDFSFGIKILLNSCKIMKDHVLVNQILLLISDFNKLNA